MSVVWVFFLLCYYFRVLLKYVSDTTCILYACCLWFRPINFQLHSVYNCKYQSNSSWLDCAFILINRTFSLSLSASLFASHTPSATLWLCFVRLFGVLPFLLYCSTAGLTNFWFGCDSGWRPISFPPYLQLLAVSFVLCNASQVHNVHYYFHCFDC